MECDSKILQAREMYRPYYNRRSHYNREYSPYPDYEIDHSQRRICSLFQSRITPRLGRIMQKHYQFTRPWSPFDRWEDQALPTLLPSCSNLTQTVYPDPSPDYNMVARRLSKEKEQIDEVNVYPDFEPNNPVPAGSSVNLKDSFSDPRNDSGFGSISDTPSSSRLPDFIPLNCEEENTFRDQNSSAQDFHPTTSDRANVILVSDDDNSIIAISDDYDEDDNEPNVGDFFAKEENLATSTGTSVKNNAKASNKPPVLSMQDQIAGNVKNQKRFFKCDYCDFKAPNKGKMMNHFDTTGHTSSAEIMGSFENETYHCKSIIDPAAVHLITRKRSLRNITDMVILCPICFKYFPSMYQCANHAKRDHNENVYGVGKVVRQQTTHVAIGLKCLCMSQFNHESEVAKHVHKCKNYQINKELHMTYIYVCPYCIRMFDSVMGCHSHIQREAEKHKVNDNVQVPILLVSQEIPKKPMLPYACGPTLQDTSENRVIYHQEKKKVMKAWRRNKSVILGSYHQSKQNMGDMKH